MRLIIILTSNSPANGSHRRTTIPRHESTRRRFWPRAALAGLALVVFAAPVRAEDGTFIEPAHPVAPPPGFISFCLRFPDQCDSIPGAETITLDRERWRALQHVNADVNWAIRPQDDATHYGRAEYWTIPSDGYGDCDDYALTKRRILIGRGLPERALRVAIVYSAHSGRHAVLVAVTDKGDFVLDNLTDAIAERRQSSYAWIEQQDGHDPRKWISFEAGTPSSLTVATTK